MERYSFQFQFVLKSTHYLCPNYLHPKMKKLLFIAAAALLYACGSGHEGH
ncbi:MAG: hypothetical protein ACI80P_001524, partial [Flavobacteriales bacterium]